jgi:serine protease Do
MPFLNDPFFRRFFGGEGEGSSRPRTQQGLGSGVIVTEDGYIITNNHVVEGPSEIRVALVSGEEFPAKVVGTDPATDIAVVKVERTGLPAITLADSSQLEVGDTVLAVGNPFGIGQTVTVGIVSGLGRGSIGIVDYEDFIQTDASINPGNSGGALTDVMGRLIGINTAILSRTGGNQGVGFAVPVNIARNVMEQIIEHGRVTRGYLGIYIQPLTPSLAKAFNLSQTKGALVANVSPKSPAAKAGLKEGDVITEFNGKPITDSKQLRLMVAQTPPDTRADVRYLRSGKEHEASVTLGELRGDELAQAQGRAEPETESAKGGFVEGVEVAELNPQIRRQLNLPREVQGVVVTDVDPGSAAERAGLQPGDIIEEVNRQPVRNLRDATTKLKQNGSVLLRVWSNGASHYIVLENAAQPRTRQR